MTSTQRNLADPLAAVGNPRFGDCLAGHIAVLRLMKRAALVTGSSPGHVEIEFEAHHAPLFAALAYDATGEQIRLQAATRADLYRMAQLLVLRIDAHPDWANRTTWYPDGWRPLYDLVKHGKQEAAPAVSAARRLLPPAAPRQSVLEALDYVADHLGRSKLSLVQAMGRTLANLRPDDESRLLGMMSHDAHARVLKEARSGAAGGGQ